MRKNLRGCYNFFVILGYSYKIGYILYEKKTDSRLNVKPDVFYKQFKIIE